MKKLIFCVMAVLMPSAHGQTVAGQSGTALGYNYQVGDHGVAILGYSVLDGAVVIPAMINGLPVTSIGEWAFSGNRVTSVVIPDSVTNIGHRAFLGCASLTNVTIGKGVTSIAEATFADCASLVSVMIPNSITNIGDYAFADTGLTSVTIPDSVTLIGNRVFIRCASLTSVTIGKSVAVFGTAMFAGCANLKSVFFKGNVPSYFHEEMFYGANEAVIYHLAGSTGWEMISVGRPIAVWGPPALTIIRLGNNQLGFTIIGVDGSAVVLEACTNLANPVWTPVGTNTLTGTSTFFSDPDSRKYPGRFYRLRSP